MNNIPGMWRAQKTRGIWRVVEGDGQLIATLADNADAEVKAQQIAANPFMLEALKSMVALIGNEDLPDNGELSGAAICDMVRAAIEMAGQ